MDSPSAVIAASHGSRPNMSHRHVRANPLDALRAPGAAWLWLAGIAVNVMRWLELLAFSLVALGLTDSPLVVALTVFARMLPLFLFSALVGTLAEGRDRRRILVVTLAGALLLSLALLGLTAADLMSVPVLLGGAFLGGIVWTIEAPLRRALLAEAGGPARIGASMSLEIATNQATRILGAVAGGAVIGLLDLRGVFALGALLYGAALVLIARSRPAGRPEAVAVPGRRVRFLTSLAEGMRCVGRSRLLVGTVIVSAIFNLWAFPYVSLAPVIGHDTFDLGPTAIGFLMASEATGGLIGAIVIALRVLPHHFRAVYGWSPVVFMAGTLGLALSPTALPGALALLVAGLGMAGFSAMQMVIPLQAAPPALRMRVLGVVSMSIGVAPLGFFHAGLMGELLGARDALRLVAAEGLLAMALTLWRYPELLRLVPPEPETEPDDKG